MSPLEKFIAEIRAKMGEMKDRANTAVANLGIIDQIQASQEVISALREFDWVCKQVEKAGELISQAEGNLSQNIETLTAEALNVKLEAEELYTAEKNEQLVNAAKDAAEQEIKAQFQKKEDDAKLILDRKGEITEAHTDKIAASMSDADLMADDYLAHAKTLSERIDKLSTIGIDEEKTKLSFKSFMACGLDEEGTQKFDAKFEEISEQRKAAGAKPLVAASLRASGGAPSGQVPPVNPKTGDDDSNGGDDEPKKKFRVAMI